MTKYKIKCRDGVVAKNDEGIFMPSVLFECEIDLVSSGFYTFLLGYADDEVDLEEIRKKHRIRRKVDFMLFQLMKIDPHIKSPFITIEKNTIWLEDLHKIVGYGPEVFPKLNKMRELNEQERLKWEAIQEK